MNAVQGAAGEDVDDVLEGGGSTGGPGRIEEDPTTIGGNDVSPPWIPTLIF